MYTRLFATSTGGVSTPPRSMMMPLPSERLVLLSSTPPMTLVVMNEWKPAAPSAGGELTSEMPLSLAVPECVR
jgi:hypothetical protein